MKTSTKGAVANPSARPLRADAERNRRLLLDAAARAFAEYGPEVSTVRIAQEAGVGQGTLYRRFPSKDHLIAAIVTDVLEEFAASAAEWQGADDAGTALHEFMAAGVQLCLKNQGFLQAIAGALSLDDAELAARYKEVLDLTGLLVTRAQEQCAIRDDVTADDILSLVGAISNAGRAATATSRISGRATLISSSTAFDHRQLILCHTRLSTRYGSHSRRSAPALGAGGRCRTPSAEPVRSSSGSHRSLFPFRASTHRVGQSMWTTKSV